ncbi:hypothetical protein JD844_013606 [Phrynosoma platyrhinos]|uniref:Uncharacterized protein n=1 Tax=Phrynosoma platyrhinos TaxID=52577 RepID=A0ABQ7TMC0_PHRPL|nr:hypothetical protein JD844_013606 [Phrynosoma platyrhinos]
MATPVSIKDLKEDALCPLCKSYLIDPVLMDCGHNFCRVCISDYYVSWKEKSGPLQCPVCSEPIHEGKLRPNQQLGSIVEKLKQISPTTVEKDYLCTKHKEKLNLFCEDDEELVCLICERSPEHKSHTVHLAEDVVQKYKDFKMNLQRCDTAFQDPVTFPLELKWKLWDFCDTNLLLENISGQYRENVTLEPDTAHPQLILSEDNKSVRMGEFYKNLPKNPERFDMWPFVLGSEGFTGGRHFWEVIVGSEEAWGIGVARDSVRRKGDTEFSPEGGFWAVGMWEGTYTAYNPPFYTLMTLHGEPKRIRVLLNYDGGWVTFFDADTGASLFAYSAASFSGETLFPFFYVFGKAQLSLTTPTV